ncbi:MAG: hypothetical protein U0930_21185 [Pirellulales bacterium]
MNYTTETKLHNPIERLPQLDAQRAAWLARLEVHRCVDLLFLFPRSYEQPAPRKATEQFEDNLRVSFVGSVVDISERVTQSGKHMYGLLVQTEDGGNVRLLWFNQMFRRNMYQRGQRLLASGVLRSTGLNWEMIQPQTGPADECRSRVTSLCRSILDGRIEAERPARNDAAISTWVDQ